MKTTFIYALCEPGTRDIRYIGKADNLKRRFSQHIRWSIKNDTHLGCWLKSLSGQLPELVVLKEIPISEWQTEERNHIREARASGARLVNATDGGDGITNPTTETRAKMTAVHLGVPLSKEHSASISRALKGRVKSLEHLANLRIALKGRKMPPISTETRKRLSEAGKGRVFSKETCDKISKALTGKTISEGAKAKMSAAKTGEKHPNFGKNLSEATRRKIGEAQKGEKGNMFGKHLSEEVKNKLSVANSGEGNPFFGRKHSEETRAKMRAAKVLAKERKGS